MPDSVPPAIIQTTNGFTMSRSAIHKWSYVSACRRPYLFWVTEWVTECLLSDGKTVEFGNRNIRNTKDLGFSRCLDKLGVTGSSPVSPTSQIHALQCFVTTAIFES